MKTKNWWQQHLGRYTSTFEYRLSRSPVPCEPLTARDAVPYNYSSGEMVNERWNGWGRPYTIPKELVDDPDYKWFVGSSAMDGSFVNGERGSDGYYDFEVRYYVGPRARAWFEEQDKKYLRDRLNAGELKKFEPEVWYMRKKDGAQNMDIGEWWVRKLAECTDETGDEMAKKLELAGKEYKLESQYIQAGFAAILALNQGFWKKNHVADSKAPLPSLPSEVVKYIVEMTKPKPGDTPRPEKPSWCCLL